MNIPLIGFTTLIVVLIVAIWFIGTYLPGYQSPKGLKIKHWLKASWTQFLNIFRK